MGLSNEQRLQADLHFQQNQANGAAFSKPQPSWTEKLSGGIGQNSCNRLWEACQRLPEINLMAPLSDPEWGTYWTYWRENDNSQLIKIFGLQVQLLLQNSTLWCEDSMCLQKTTPLPGYQQIFVVWKIALRTPSEIEIKDKYLTGSQPHVKIRQLRIHH